MKKSIEYQVIDWLNVPKTEHKGEPGMAWWQTLQLEGLRIRIVEYSPGYIADHWCQKGHIVHCLEGELLNELQNGGKQLLTKGMTYIVSDDLSSHRSSTESGVRLLIIDGESLGSKL
jgi:quercetin dioxygenase-like cupin family protein